MTKEIMRAMRRQGPAYAAALVLASCVMAARADERAATTVGAPLNPTPAAHLSPDLRCLLGVYSFPDGSVVTVTGSAGHPRDLEYTLSGREFGTWRERSPGTFSALHFEALFSSCEDGTLTLTRGDAHLRGTRVPLGERRTTFASDGVKLQGKLVLPAGGRARALAVWIEGSNNDPSTDDAVWQYELARRAVAVFVYDKRGTGASGGEQSSDFFLRARDTAAAVAEARRLAPGIRRVGVIGGSQGGWVAPLVATLTALDFIMPVFALADGPIAQDQALVEQSVRDAGFDGEALAQARTLTAITERIVRSNLAQGFDALDAFKREHANASWLAAIQPRSYTGLFLQFSTDEIRTIGPAAAQGLSFTYDPRPVIQSIAPRQLWLLGGADRQAPNAATQRILREIQRRSPNVFVVVFPDADHGLSEAHATPKGSTRAYVPRLFDVAAQWILAHRLPGTSRFIVMPTKEQ